MKAPRLLAAFGAAALAACASSAIPQPSAADATRASAHFPDTTLAELEQGRTLYVSRCGGCHVLKPPSELSAEQWAQEVSEMRSKNGVKLSDSEAQAITRYLFVAAKGPRMVESVDDRRRGARLVRREEGAYWPYVTDEQRNQPGWIGREGD